MAAPAVSPASIRGSLHYCSGAVETNIEVEINGRFKRRGRSRNPSRAEPSSNPNGRWPITLNGTTSGRPNLNPGSNSTGLNPFN
jgi:hypothetical protein